MTADPRPRMLLLLMTDLSKEPRANRQIRHFGERFHLTTVGEGGLRDGVDEHIPLSSAVEVPVLLRKFLYVVQTLAFRMRWYRLAYWAIPLHLNLRRMLRDGDWDVVIAHDVMTLPIAASIRSRRGFIADMHEYAPRQYDDTAEWIRVVAPYYGWLCRTYLPRAARVLTVGQGIADEYSKQFGVKVDVIINATDPAPLIPGIPSRPLRLVHSGIADPARRIETMVDAVLATDADVTLDLFLVPSDEEYVAALRRRIGDDPRVVLQDPVVYRELVARLNGYDVGLSVIAATTFNHHWSLPNKFFDYVQARLAIVVGPSPEMAALVDAHDLGVVLPDFEVESLAELIRTLTPEAVATWKANADVASGVLTGDTEMGKLAALIDGL